MSRDQGRLGGTQPRLRDGFNDTDPRTVASPQLLRSRRLRTALALLLPFTAWGLSRNMPEASIRTVRFVERTDAPAPRLAAPRPTTSVLTSTPETTTTSTNRVEDMLEKAETYHQQLREAERRLRQQGLFVIQAIGDAERPGAELLCAGTRRYRVAEGDSREGIARRERVHYRVDGKRYPVSWTSMEFAIERANPDSSYSEETPHELLQAGDELLLPVDGTCSPVSEEELFARAGLPVPERYW
jgi:hypothetical protein